MKIFDFLKILFSFSLPWLSASSLANSDSQLPEVACRYEMKVTPHGKFKATSTKAWFFWRKPGMVQTQDADGHYGEIWQRTANGSIQYRKLYHVDKTAIEYMPADMPTNNMSFDWIKLSSMLDQQELHALKPVKKTRVLDRSAELRKGKVDNRDIEVLWLPDVSLPASIISKDKTGRAELRLIAIEPLSATHRKPVDIEEIANYRHIDAADFGDMENDPFVKKVMAFTEHHNH
ncbi:MAG: hypothetical protein PHG00_11260 [Methylococcales bacterium]|nr:hypothetical protein [Methylococcales bacterium]